MSVILRPIPARTRFTLGFALLLSAVSVSAARAQSTTLLRVRNAASVDRLVVDSAGGLVMRGSLASGSIPTTATGPRMMWWPAKAAFRAVAGSTEPASAIGQGSAAFGEENQAPGADAFAIGSATYAYGAQSFAAGTGTAASGPQSFAIGYATQASGNYTLATGQFTVANGNASTAMGSYASTNTHPGSFVYADASTGTVFNATADNQFSVRASGGVRFYSNSALSAGVTLAAGGGSWTTVSDRRRKEAFLAIDGEDMLARIRTLPLSTWRYIAEQDRLTRHIGPMAQDWNRAFGFSRDSLTINTGDIDGVNLAGVQALEARSRVQAERITTLEAELRGVRMENQAQGRELAATQARLARLERMMAELKGSDSPPAGTP